MKLWPILALCVTTLGLSEGLAQTTVTSGNWSDPTVWSAGAIPASTGTVNVNNPLTIDQNITITTGAYTINANATDLPGGTKYKLNISGGTLDVFGILTLEGGTAAPPGGNNNQFDGGVITVKSGGTLIIGHTQLQNGVQLNVDAGGTLIINGDLTNKANSGPGMTIAGAVFINGNYDGQTGNATVSGTGTFNTTGTMSTNGGATIFGSTNDCSTGPCSGTNLTCTFTNTISPTSKAVCSGSTGGTLTATTSAGTPSYQWLSSTDNITYVNASGTSTNSTYVTPVLSQTTWYKVQITSHSGAGNPCTSTSAYAQITVVPNTGGGWIGTTSTSWAVGTNWCGGSVPIGSTNVTITNASGMANLPVILAGTTALCNDLTLSSTFPATTLTINATGILKIAGNFTNNGTFTDNTSAATDGVHLVGTTSQTISGTSPNTVSDLTINNTSGATPAVNLMTNNLSVTRSLSLTSGLVNLNGYTVTLGTSALAGTITYATGYFYGGNIERWVPTTSFTLGTTSQSVWPIGTIADYRPIYFASTGLAGGGASTGTIKARHTAVSGATPYATPFTDNGGTVQIHSNSFWTVTTGNGLATTGSPFSIRTEGTGMGTVALGTDLRIALATVIAPGSDGAHGASTTNPQVNRSGISLANLPNSYYWGSISPLTTTLPISLKYFKGNGNQGQVDLEWSTETEHGNDFFTVLHSTDGEKFGEVARLAGNGNSTEEHVYNLTHTDPAFGTNYYLLRQTDYDGLVADLKVISVKVDRTYPTAHVYPNPAGKNQLLTFEVNNSDTGQGIDVQLINMQGQIFYQGFASKGDGGHIAISFSTADIPQGVYILKAGAFRTRIVIQ